MPVEANDFVAKSALFLPREAQYSYLLSLPENIAEAGIKNKDGHTMNSLGEAVNNAMSLIEEQSEQLTGVLPKTYTDFSDEILSELLRIFNNSALDEVGGDVIGRIYEYFLNKFAKNIASDDGVFFTPKSLVKMIVNVLEPKGGVLLDPACGSGGMFIQSGDFVNQAGMNANNAMTFYGQEKVEYNAQLCQMNMAVHGLTGVIRSGDEANTFYHDAHGLVGSCDYVMANPPFNVDKVKAESCESAGRLPFGMPGVNKNKEVGNANYLWISYFYSYLNEHGRAGFVMASSATDSSGKDRDIRRKLVETGHVDVMVSVGNNFFYTKSLPCSLWFSTRESGEHPGQGALYRRAELLYGRRPHAERVERVAAQKPERDRVAVPGRDGEIYVAAGGIHPVFPDMQRVYHRERSAARVCRYPGHWRFCGDERYTRFGNRGRKKGLQGKTGSCQQKGQEKHSGGF